MPKVKGRRCEDKEVLVPLLPTFAPVELRKTISQTSRSAFANCRRKFFYEYGLGLDPRGLKIPFIVGSAVHNELDRLYQNLGRYGEAGIEESWDNINRYFASIRDGSHEEHKCNTPNDAEKLAVSEAQAMGIIAAYVRRYEMRDAERFEVIQPEQAFELPLVGTSGWSVTGKIDLRYRVLDTPASRKDGSVGHEGIMEHKTTSKIDQFYVAKIEMDRQTVRYGMAAEKLDPTKLVEEITYNAIAKTSIRQGKGTFTKFVERIAAEYEGDPDKYFYRTRFKPRRPLFDEVQADDANITREIERANETGVWYQNFDHCYAFYSVCPYMRLCVEGVDQFTLMDFEEDQEKLDNPAAREV